MSFPQAHKVNALLAGILKASNSAATAVQGSGQRLIRA